MEDGIVFFAEGWGPIILHQENEGSVDETPDQHVILVHSTRDVNLTGLDPKVMAVRT